MKKLITLLSFLLIFNIGHSQQKPFLCPDLPAIQKDISGVAKYVKGSKSIIDSEKDKLNKELTAPLDNFLENVANMSTLYFNDSIKDAGICAVHWLEHWAKGGALLGKMVHIDNDQAEYERQWINAGLSITYLKVKPAANVEQRKVIEDWLVKIANANMEYWDKTDKKPNNHYYWTGVGIMGTALATHNQSLIALARKMYQSGINDITDNGSLPLEMARKERAFHYHIFALDALVVMAEMSLSLNENWYTYNNWRIDLLADRVAKGYLDNATWFEEQAGAKQEKQLPGHKNTGWAEFYRLRAKNTKRFDVLHNAGPIYDPRIGGDITTLANRKFFELKKL
jgi:poly(beta-D-mannuronate) lyase